MKEAEIFRSISDIMWSKDRGLKLDWEQSLALAYIRTISLQRKMSLAKRYVRKKGGYERAIRDVNVIFELTIQYTKDLFEKKGVIL